MLNGYGESAILSALAEEAATTGLGGRGTRGRRRRQKKRKSRAAAKRWRARGQGLPDCIRKLRNCRSRCPNASGFGEDWEDVDETIQDLYMGGFSGNPSTLGYLSNLYMSGFGALDPVEAAAKELEGAFDEEKHNCAIPKPSYPGSPCDISRKKLELKRAELDKLQSTSGDEAGGGLPKWALPVAVVAIGIGGFLWFRSK